MHRSTPFPAASPCLRLLLLFLCLTPAGLLAQATSSDYTTSLPSVQKVETQLQGTDPTDTAARQVAIFEYLQSYIQRIKETRDYRGAYTPGEMKHLTDYAKAQYDLTQSFTKTHTPAEVAAFNHLEGKYSVDNALDWIKQLEGQQAADTYKGTEAALSAAQQRNNARIQQDLSQSNSQSGGGGLFGGGGGSLTPSQKRCLELGGTYNNCAGLLTTLTSTLGGLLTGFMGGGSDASGPPALNGIVLVGHYHSRTELPEILMNADGTATLQKCGTLVDAAHNDTIRKSGAVTQIVLDNEPDPIVLTLRPDGSLAGPGTISVKGNIVTGYRNQYSCTAGTRYTAANCTTTSTPIYAPSMQRCAVSLLAPLPAPPIPPKEIGLMADMFGGVSPFATVYGFRVAGDYRDSGGLQLSFADGFVTLDCGQAHIDAPYVVDDTASQFVVRVQNAGGAFALAVAPDDTLRGSGSATVNGRLVSAVNGENVSFTPHTESCTIGTLAPMGKRNTMLASNAPMPAAPSYSAPAPAPAALTPAVSRIAAPSAAPVSAPVAPASSGMRLAIATSFPGESNPLAGRIVFLMSDRFDNALRKSGGPIAANTTPGKALQAYAANCVGAHQCPTITPALNKFYVGKATFDATGRAIMDAPVPPGNYYIFATGKDTAGTLVWDLPANLQPGNNNITLQDNNAEVLH